jgi:hypothetical protein
MTLLSAWIFVIVLPHEIDKSLDESVKNGCFIATACYGDYDAPEVRVFRRYRDERLSKPVIGRMFIRTYYFLSPPLARMISRSEIAKRQIRKYILQPLLSKLEGYGEG